MKDEVQRRPRLRQGHLAAACLLVGATLAAILLVSESNDEDEMVFTTTVDEVVADPVPSPPILVGRKPNSHTPQNGTEMGVEASQVHISVEQVDGTPITGASVLILADKPTAVREWSAPIRDALAEGVTDSEGRLKLSIREPQQPVRVIVSSSGHGTSQKRLAPPLSPVESLAFRLSPAQRASGVVVLPDGSPVEDVRVVALGSMTRPYAPERELSSVPESWWTAGRTNSEGKFLLDVVSDDLGEVRVADSGWLTVNTKRSDMGYRLTVQPIRVVRFEPYLADLGTPVGHSALGIELNHPDMSGKPRGRSLSGILLATSRGLLDTSHGRDSGVVLQHMLFERVPSQEYADAFLYWMSRPQMVVPARTRLRLLHPDELLSDHPVDRVAMRVVDSSRWGGSLRITEKTDGVDEVLLRASSGNRRLYLYGGADPQSYVATGFRVSGQWLFQPLPIGRYQARVYGGSLLVSDEFEIEITAESPSHRVTITWPNPTGFRLSVVDSKGRRYSALRRATYVPIVGMGGEVSNARAEYELPISDASRLADGSALTVSAEPHWYRVVAVSREGAAASRDFEVRAGGITSVVVELRDGDK